jgi:hypothetical protein
MRWGSGSIQGDVDAANADDELEDRASMVLSLLCFVSEGLSSFCYRIVGVILRSDVGTSSYYALGIELFPTGHCVLCMCNSFAAKERVM